MPAFNGIPAVSDCTHVPAAEDAPGNIGTDPDALFRSGQVKGLSEGQAQAIKDGADPAQVVNSARVRVDREGVARKSISPDGMFTTEGITRRGVGSRARAKAGLTNRQARATPDAIYKYATDRDDALTLLRQNGYLR